MMVRYGIWIIIVALLIWSGGVWAGGITNHQSNGALSDVGGNECVVDLTITSLPATINSTLVGNDCGLRGFADRTYKVQLAQSGSYSFVVSTPTGLVDTYMAIMTGCCAGDVLVWDDDGVGIPNGPSALYCITLAAGDYYVVLEAKSAQGNGGSFTLNISACPDPCTTSFLNPGDNPLGEGNLRRFVQNVDASSTSPFYTGPFTNPHPCQSGVTSYGFDRLNWFDEDFGWQHSFNPSTNDTSAHPCVDLAILLICAWDVDINGCAQPASELATCERDRVYINGAPVAPGTLAYLQGSNYANSVSGFTLPPDLVLSGPLNVWADIDEFSPSCNWATNIHRSQLQVIYRWNHRPYTPTANASSCVTANSPMCVTITGPEIADPDGDAVQCSYRWYRFNGETWTLTADTTSCAAPGTYHTGEQWKVEIRCKDDCGLVSQAYTHEFTIVPSCNDNPPVGWDYGDLGGCYPTGTELTGGPANRIYQQNIAWLGPTVTPDASPNIPNADGGDDGVEFLNSTGRRWHPCETEGVVVTITTGPGYTNQPMYLYAWKDGDTNCHFGDMLCDGQVSECFIHARPEVAGRDTIYFTDPGVLFPHPYDGIFRFRLLSASMSCDSALTYIDPLLGETEDYVKTDLQLFVQLLSFTATSDGRAISLSWSTASEQSSDHFVLERRSGESWVRTAQLRAAGTSGTQRNYRYRDEDVDAGRVYEYRLVAVDMNEEQQVVASTQVAATEQNGQAVDDYRLYVNYPNPFNPTTTISFDLKEAGAVRLRVFDVTGRLVTELVNGSMNAGHYSEVFDAKNLPSGLYFYRLETPQFWDMKKMILLK